MPGRSRAYVAGSVPVTWAPILGPLPFGGEHEMIDEQLRAALEQIGQGGAAFVGVEAIVLVDLDPGQLLAAARQLVAAVGQVLLGLEQVEALGAPLFAGNNPMSRHRFPLLRWRW